MDRQRENQPTAPGGHLGSGVGEAGRAVAASDSFDYLMASEPVVLTWVGGQHLRSTLQRRARVSEEPPAGEWGDRLRTGVFIPIVDSWDEGVKMDTAASVHCFLASTLSCLARLAAMGSGLGVGLGG